MKTAAAQSRLSAALENAEQEKRGTPRGVEKTRSIRDHNRALLIGVLYQAILDASSILGRGRRGRSYEIAEREYVISKHTRRDTFDWGVQAIRWIHSDSIEIKSLRWLVASLDWPESYVARLREAFPLESSWRVYHGYKGEKKETL